MFIKLVVLILVCGSSGVGLLSVRQSRLQAAHEMAEARHRIQRLDEQTGEVRMQIARACTPERVNELLKNHRAKTQGYDPAIQHPAQFDTDLEAPTAQQIIEQPGSDLSWIDDAFNLEHAWILDE